MKFHDFEDFLSKSSAESEIERLRKAQAEIRRIKKRRLTLAAFFLTMSVASITVYLLLNHGYSKSQNQPGGGSSQVRD